MKKLLFILCFILLSAFVSAQCQTPKEGYTNTEDCMTTYKLSDLEALFGEGNVIEPGIIFSKAGQSKQDPGYIEIFHANDQPLLKLNGTMIANPSEKTLKVKGSAQLAMQTKKGQFEYKLLVSGEELEFKFPNLGGSGAISSYNINVKEGSYYPLDDDEAIFAAEAKEFGVYIIETEKALELKLFNATAYLFRPFGEKVVIDCSSEMEDQCRMVVQLESLIIYGNGKLTEYAAGNKGFADVSNLDMSFFKIDEVGNTIFFAKTKGDVSVLDAKSRFGPLIFSTEEIVKIAYMRSSIPLVYFYAGDGPAYIQTIVDEDNYAKLFAAYPPWAKEGIVMDWYSLGKLNIKEGAFSMLQTKFELEEYKFDIKSSAPTLGLTGAIYTDGTDYHFYLQEHKYTYDGKEENHAANVELELPQETPIEYIKIAKISPGDKSQLVLKSEKVPGKKMVFTYDDVKVSQKSNWFDFGVSFRTHVYDKKEFKSKELRCDIATKKCYLGNKLINDLNDLKKPITCASNDDCSQNQKCIKKGKKSFCAYDAKCELAYGENAPKKKMDILVIGDGYSYEEKFESEIEKFLGVGLYIDEGMVDPIGGLGSEAGTFFSISPFMENQDKFAIWKMPIVDLDIKDSDNPFIGTGKQRLSLKANCPQADQVAIFSTKRLWAQADSSNHMFFISSLEDDGVMFAHEFGHSFGNLADEYYHPKKNKDGYPHKPNCLTSVAQARSVWGQVLKDKKAAKELVEEAQDNWKGCGGYCGKKCTSYLRPSENSIMNSPTTSSEFNLICKTWLEERLSKYE